MKTQVLYTLTTALTVTLFPTATPKDHDALGDVSSYQVDSTQAQIFDKVGSGNGLDFAWESASLDSARLMQAAGSNGSDSGFSSQATPKASNDDPLAWEVVDASADNGVSTGSGSIAELAQAAVTGAESKTDGAAEGATDAKGAEKPAVVEPTAPAAPTPATDAVDAAATPATKDAPKTKAVNLLNKSESSIADLVGGTKPAVPAGEEAPATVVAGDPMEAIDGNADDGFFIREAQLNDVFQFLAKSGGLNYFHNAELAAPSYVVTGHLQDGEPLQQMEELGLMYGITIHKKGTTVYAMTEGQLAQLPTKPFLYQLKYLRPSDIDQIKAILQPVLTPGRGTVDYETKTNTLIVIDNEQKVAALQEILKELDQPKRQVAIEMRILRVTSGSRNRIGVDWSTVLGDDGIALGADSALNNLFNLPDEDTATQLITLTNNRSFDQLTDVTDTLTADGLITTAGTRNTLLEANQSRDSLTTRNITSTGTGLVLDSVALDAVMRALNQGNLAEQESSPTLITEDNEQGIISLIDRIPIIVATVNNNSAGSNITEEVRYRIDTDDPVDDPANTREVGVTMSITPTILPDGTIRMVMRPRSAQIVEFIVGQTGNRYPRVAESTVDTIARVPDGSSLLIGGFYEQSNVDRESKVPILGDIPWVNFFFKSTDKEKRVTSLVFVVTPTAYDAESPKKTMEMTKQLHDRQVLPFDHNWPDRKNPGFNHEANLGRTLGNALKLYPEVPEWNPLAAEHPINEAVTSAAAAQQPPANHRKPRNPLIRIFGFGKK